MSIALAKTNATANPFAEYAAALAARRIDGKLLKFVKGDYLAGSEGALIETGTALVAVMNSLTVGWQKWLNMRPVDSVMGLISENFKPPRRNELGDENSATWETDADGDLKDPWQFINNTVFVSPDMEEVYTFTTSSRGGFGAIGKLCASHAKAPAGKYPLVRLAVDSYPHRDKSRGRVKIPVFEFVELVASAPFDEALARSRGGEPRPTIATPSKPVAAPAIAPAIVRGSMTSGGSESPPAAPPPAAYEGPDGEFDDAIPF
jgi:hypothetical protein